MESRMRRGRGLTEPHRTPHAQPKDITKEVEEMLRATSSMSRPSSQTESRPCSPASRPGSALPRNVARKLERIGSPDRDSPVCTPKLRQKEKEEKAKSSIDGMPHRPESRQATP